VISRRTPLDEDEHVARAVAGPSEILAPERATSSTPHGNP
jgi:hypothetical protein